MSEDLKKLRERMSTLSDAELLGIVKVEYRDYRPEAIEFAKSELDSRGVDYGRGGPAARQVDRLSQDLDDSGDEYEDDENGEDDSIQNELAEFKPSFCIVCGAETRNGYLFAGRGEMTVVFSDNNEERFVELDACPKCGHVRLSVDFDTEVAD